MAGAKLGGRALGQHSGGYRFNQTAKELPALNRKRGRSLNDQ